MQPALIGDIGGTHARFALARDRQFEAVQILNVADYPSLQAAIEAYLKKAAAGRSDVRVGALAVAGPVTGDHLAFTNHPWSFSIKELTRALGFHRLHVVNDFVAQALAVPWLGENDRRQVGPGSPAKNAPFAIIGPGTGLGVSSLIPSNTRDGDWIPVAGEGGHVTMPSVTAREAAVIERLHQTGIAHVSAERLICGQGLTTLYTTLAGLDGKQVSTLSPADVTKQAIAGNDPYAREAVAMFCALLGTAAGNLALTVGARGGLYIGGGIVPQLGDSFDRSEFRARFVAKGRMQAFLDPIPTYVITHELPAFVGLTTLVEGG